MRRSILVAILGGLLTSIVCGSDGPAVRMGRFGISGIIPDASYLKELQFDCATSDFWIDPEEGFLGIRKEELHTRQLRSFVEQGISPIATLYLGAATEKVVRHCTAGQGAADVGAPVRYWELGDEQNGAWGTACASEEYARRVSILAPAIRRACPDCQIVMGGLLDGPKMGDWALGPYLQRFLSAGGGA